MKARHKRIALIVAGLAVLGIGTALVLNAFNSNLVFFFSPTQVLAGEAPKGKTFRIGGLVKEGSVERLADGVSVRFAVTDTDQTLPVQYKGILPDLFKEGKGVVAQGKLDDAGLFVATEVLAKHDETYMPRELAEKMEAAHTKHNVPDAGAVSDAP